LEYALTRQTDRYSLSILGPGDSLNADGYKAVDADRRLIDRLLQYATEQHRHTGATGDDHTPTAPPNVALQPTGGAIGAGERYFYTYTIIDETGTESAPAPHQAIDSPPAVATPNAPALTTVSGTGSLLPGTWSYVLSAYRGANTQETKAEISSVIALYGVNPGSISMVLPDLPLMADGLNIYRKAPSGLHYLYLTSIANPTNGQAWVDDGSIEGDCDRSLPGVNRTSAENSVLVEFPGATPALAEGWSWRIYRTDNASDWSYSYLIDMPAIGGATPYTPLEFLDVGLGSQTGGPPLASQVVNAPPKIELTDATEVDGYLPPGLFVVPTIVTFTFSGVVAAGDGTFTWVCEYDEAQIVQARAYLGVDETPETDEIVTNLLLRRASTGSTTWEPLFTGTGPSVPVASNIGPVTSLDPPVALQVGDMLTTQVEQTDSADVSYLSINVTLLTRSGSTDTSYPWLI
jgi:hypothetical protein